MGNSGSIVIETEHSHFNPGETLRGFATVVVEQPVMCTGLYLSLKGKEKTRIVESSSQQRGNQRVSSTTTYYSSRQLIEDSVCLFEAMGDGPISPGTYSFPFSFDLPCDLPSSFFRRGASTEGLIKYKLKAEFVVNGSFNKNWKKTKEVFIFESASLYDEEPVQISEERPIKLFGCFSNGLATIEAQTDTNCFLAGDEIVVRAQISSKKNIKTIKAELVRFINVQAERRSDYDRKVLCTATAPNEGEAVLTLQIPPDLKYPSTDGKYVTVWYEVVVRGHVSLSKDPRVELPVVICYDK